MRKRKCLYCEKLFEPRRKDHMFCEPNCQQWHYRKFGTIRVPKEYQSLFRCPDCRVESVLNFDPTKDWKKWLNFRCSCGYSPGG